MFQRPRVGETEEDLLKQEEEFLKQSGKPPNLKRTYEATPNEGKTPRAAGIIGDIIEKNQNSSNRAITDNEGLKDRGFPAIFQIDSNIATSRKIKKSLFALHMEKNKASSMELKQCLQGSSAKMPETSEDCKMECEETFLVQESISGSKNVQEEVHNENLDKISKMSENEILEAQRKLYEMLDPKLIDFLKSKGKGKETVVKEKISVSEDVEMKLEEDVIGEMEIKKKLSTYVGEKWVNMDFVEKEKLEWVGDIPDSKALEPDKPYSARFDFKGELQPFTLDTIDVTKYLHHHGDEPERPGYTIQELYQLSRSTVLQQRILALNTLANIIRKTKLGYYDVCFDGCLLRKLLDSDLFLLLRFSIDENALIPPAINCLRRLLYNDSDEYCLDKLLGVTDHDVQPLIYDKMETNEVEEKELKDHTIINCDVIKGVLRTDLLVRLTYILNIMSCDREVVTNAILCFIRITRHSIDSSNQIMNKPDLLSFVYSCVKCERPIYQGVKLFRILVGQSEVFASRFSVNYPMNFLINYINLEELTEIPKVEFFLLKRECLYLWRNLLKHDLMIDEFRSWTPCFIRLLRFYVEKVDFCGEGDFDFELFAAMLSILRLCVRKKLQIEANFVTLMCISLEKWLKQLMYFQKFHYSGLKALGACFAFFIDYFKVFEIDQTGLRFIQKLNPVVMALIDSNVFDSMCHSLVTYSHILGAHDVKRDPTNLPSLCSISDGGHDYLGLVNNQSSLPFFIQFVKYLNCSYTITHDTKINIELFLRNPNIQNYITKIINVKKNSDNWFVRYELLFITDVIKLFCIAGDENTMKLAFRVLPMIRVDDDNSETVLSVITNSKFWLGNDNLLAGLFEIYSESVYIPVPNCDCVLRYKNDLVGEDWMYKLLTLLRGTEAVAEVGKALKFIYFVLKSNCVLLERVPYNIRYYHLCAVFLTDDYVFDEEIETGLKNNFECILSNRDKVLLDKKLNKNKSFYDLYTELITQYAGVSYGLQIFAQFVLFPLQNRFDISFRKLLWFEYLHVLRVITLPYPISEFLEMKDFAEPCETDESLLVAYLNSVASGIISRNRNPFVYNIAVTNVKNYLQLDSSNSKLSSFLRQKIYSVKNERLRKDLTS